MTSSSINVLLADDDLADCLLFKDALEELPISTALTTVNNGDALMDELSKKNNPLPDVLFLDLNMPRKNGFAALGLIKRNNALQRIPVVIFTTVSGPETVKSVFRDAAHYYICKPSDFSQLKKVIYQALLLTTEQFSPFPDEDNFRITGETVVIPEKH